MYRHYLLFGAAILLILAFGTGEAAAATAIGLTHGSVKHRPEFAFEANDAYRLYSARNEWEPLLVLIRDDDGLTNVNVTISEFAGPGEAISEIDLYRVHYVPVLPGEVSHMPPDPSREGWWPDGLVPFVDHFDYEVRDGAPFDVEAEFAQAVFIDIYVPEDQTPGDYQATVTVTADGMTDWTGTATLTVWNFTLPNGMSLQSNYAYSRDGICEYYTTHGSTTDCEVLHQRHFLEYARHRMSPYRWENGDPVTTWDPGTGTITVDWTAWDAAQSPYLDGTFYRPGFEFQTIGLPRSFGGCPEELTQDEWNIMNWAAWADHFHEEGWIEKAWCYLPDEPDPSQYGALAQLAANIHAADPDLQPFVTEQYEENLGPDIDIWCPDEPMFSDSLPWPPYPEVYEDLRAEGKKTWWYNCVSANIGFDYANHMVDQESTYMRTWLWLTRRYGFTGILFWRIQYLWDRQNVWEDMYADRFACQGDGTLFYPGVPEEIGGTTDIPIPSLRIKALREAMEDYEYFHILDERGDSAWVDDVTRTVAPKTFQWEHDPLVILDWRRKVAEKILGTLDETPPAPPTDLSGTAQVEAIALTWTPAADADLAGYDIWYAIYDGDAFFGGSVEAQATGAVITGLTPNRDHHVWVQSFDANGNRSTASDEVVVTPLADEDDGDDDAGDDRHNPNGVGVTGLEAPDGVGADETGGDSENDDDPAGCGC